MSKELETFNRVWEDCSKLDLDYVSKHNLMDDLREIKQALQQAQKQEKLLKLYQRLYKDFDDLTLDEQLEIEKQIKGIENETN